MAVHIRRDRVFEDSFRELHRRTAEEMKNRLYIVFDGEEGQDAGTGFSSKTRKKTISIETLVFEISGISVFRGGYPISI